MLSTSNEALVPCTVLATTGGSIDPMLILGASALVVLGLVFLLVGRRRRTSGMVAATLLVALAFFGAGTIAAAPAQAASSQCAADPATGMSLSVEQTSVMEGLAPGVEPAAIAGIVTNTGGMALHIESVGVRIVSVSKADDAVDGTCDASDYLLLDASMPVDRGLTAGQIAPFAGAAIGFSDKSMNQDACKKATVHLEYDVTVR